MKQLLLGDEAVALGALHAGLSGVYAYPGTPSTEITEYIQQSPLARQRGVHARWCTNEKTAMEAALGMSYAGKRALICMKHVGMNVCADAFVNSAITGVNGGLVVLAADDPSMHSSQNEQDSRFYGQFALIPILEPSNQQEAYDMMPFAFDLSEHLKEPVLLRIVTRLAHSRAAVETAEEPRPENRMNPSTDQWVLLPGIARKKYAALIGKQPLMEQEAANSPFNRTETPNDSATPSASAKQASASATPGIIVCGIGYNYIKEVCAGEEIDLLKVSHYPLPAEAVRALAARHDSLLVVEDGQPVVEQEVKRLLGAGYRVMGRLTGALPRTGELNPDHVAAALGHPSMQAYQPATLLAARPPQLCQGCGHRDVYAALVEIINAYPDARVFGDIGCYTLGALPPFKALSSCVDMGASITMAKGAADAGLRPAIAVIGDSTFTHSGMTGLLDAINANAPITVIISDNLTTGMTGGQDSAGLNKYEAICLGLGMDPAHLHVVTPLPKNIPAIAQLLREEIAYEGVSVIIPRRECIQTAARHARQARQEKA